MASANWRDIPSLDNIEIDWDYEPENPNGKRSWVRIGKKNLYLLLNVKNIAVKIVSSKIDETGSLIDISPAGLAVLLNNTSLTVGTMIKIGLLLGKQKVLSRAVVRNVCSLKDKNRIGLEFLEPAEKDISFITGLISSKAYKF